MVVTCVSTDLLTTLLRSLKEELPRAFELREKLHAVPEPTLIEDDPTGLDEEERRRLGIIELPGSLEEALGALESDEVVRSWLSKDLLDCYSSVKRNEIDLLEGAEPREACERYLRVY